MHYSDKIIRNLCHTRIISIYGNDATTTLIKSAHMITLIRPIGGTSPTTKVSTNSYGEYHSYSVFSFSFGPLNTFHLSLIHCSGSGFSFRLLRLPLHQKVRGCRKWKRSSNLPKISAFLFPFSSRWSWKDGRSSLHLQPFSPSLSFTALRVFYSASVFLRCVPFYWMASGTQH